MKGLIAGKAHPLCELAGIADTSAMTKVSSLWQPAQPGWHGVSCRHGDFFPLLRTRVVSAVATLALQGLELLILLHAFAIHLHQLLQGC